MNAALQIARLVAVLALVCVAAAIATPKGRLPLALRGLAKVLGDGRAGSMTPHGSSDFALQSGLRPADTPRFGRFHRNRPTRLLAFVLVLLAILLALI